MGYNLEKDPKTVECELIFCSFVFESVNGDRNKWRMRIIALADPKLEMIPQWLINFFIKMICMAFLS
jgi:hypothetical protein